MQQHIDVPFQSRKLVPISVVKECLKETRPNVECRRIKLQFKIPSALQDIFDGTLS